jgi:imidazolonepropionase-like amidohydrolase
MNVPLVTGIVITIAFALPCSGPVAELLAQERTERPTINPAPNRASGEGLGPFRTLVIRGAILIDGTGAPPVGPVDIVVSNNRIQSIRSAGTPVLPLRPKRPPENADHEIDATGMYVMPGFIDNHVHAGEAPKNPDAEYPYKLWMAHGVTTVRGVPLGDNAFSVREKERSARNEIVAPRIYNYQRPGNGWDKGSVDTPEAARDWVRWAAANGVDGMKLGANRPEITAALLDEAKKHGLGSTAHLQQTGVAQMNALNSARLGLRTVTHFYGHFEALMKDYVVQPWPVDQIRRSTPAPRRAQRGTRRSPQSAIPHRASRTSGLLANTAALIYTCSGASPNSKSQWRDKRLRERP